MTQAQLPLFDEFAAPEESNGQSPTKHLVREDQPLYRYHAAGPNSLSTAELLALVLGTPASLETATTLLLTFGSLHQLARASHAQLTRLMGIGNTQAARLRAIVELCRRLEAPPAEERVRVTNPTEVAALLMPSMRDLEHEEVRVVLLDTRNCVLKVQTVYRGSLNTSVIRVAELFRPAIELQAAAILVAHNHPSNDPSPSPEDASVTREICKAGKLLDIEVLDHIVLGNGRWVSLRERGLGFDTNCTGKRREQNAVATIS